MILMGPVCLSADTLYAMCTCIDCSEHMSIAYYTDFHTVIYH